jgi:hypothetical protein
LIAFCGPVSVITTRVPSGTSSVAISVPVTGEHVLDFDRLDRSGVSPDRRQVQPDVGEVFVDDGDQHAIPIHGELTGRDVDGFVTRELHPLFEGDRSIGLRRMRRARGEHEDTEQRHPDSGFHLPTPAPLDRGAAYRAAG